MKMKLTKEDVIRGLSIGHHNKAESASSVHVGNKVLPITDLTSSSSSALALVSTSNVDDGNRCRRLSSSEEKQDRVKGGSNNKAKALFKLKELMRWAASVKSENATKLGRKVLHFRNKSATIKSGGGIDGHSNISNNDSPKISFSRWEVESCCTTCSAASAPPSLFTYDRCSSKRGSWITTDDDFVVLEL